MLSERVFFLIGGNSFLNSKCAAAPTAESEFYQASDTNDSNQS